MAKVSVLGLGSMGSAIARVLLSAGNQVTVWNRTASKMDALVSEGANGAKTAGSAIASSAIIIVCVADYNSFRRVVDQPDTRKALTGRVLVQLSTGRPQEARESEIWIRENGAEYLDGAILAYPNQMGTAQATILVAGSEVTYAKCESTLQALAGSVMYVGNRIGSASALDCATLSFLISALIGFVHGARICRSEDLSVDAFGAMMAEVLPVIGEELKQQGKVIQTGQFNSPQASLGTYAAAAQGLVEQAEDARINPEFPAFTLKLFQKAVHAGYADEEVAALIKT